VIVSKTFDQFLGFVLGVDGDRDRLVQRTNPNVYVNPSGFLDREHVYDIAKKINVKGDVFIDFDERWTLL
jgi:hypothetical protein